MSRCFAAAFLLFSSVLAAAQSTRPAGGTTRPASSPETQPEMDARTGRIVSGHARMDLAARVTTGMNGAARRLVEAMDAGELTQALQKQVIDDLDQAVQQLQNQRSRSRQKSSGEKGGGGDSRSLSRQRGGSEPRPSAVGNQPAADARGGGGPAVEARPQAPAPDLRSRWGELPQRERDALLQGYNEQSLPRYRAWVERYYRTLAQSRGAGATQPAATP